MLAYHFPPIRGSSGVHRTLKFSRHLADHGWEAMVLTVHPRAYPATGEDQMGDVPAGMVVRRSFALDTARHLSLAGRYPGALALPDRWASWLLSAVPAGLALVRRYRPRVLWSTFPVATAHLAGLALARLTGLPWVADFRDSMTEDAYPPGRVRWRTWRGIEARTLRRAQRSVFTTPGTLAMYTERYPGVDPARLRVIANGYDEEAFGEAERDAASARAADGGRPLTLIHSGLLYPSERDPRPFFAALAGLVNGGAVRRGDLRVVLRASGHDGPYRALLEQHGIADVVELAPSLPYREALREMLEADGLLLFQAASCNHQIPAKLYEYLRARRPILALTDPRGDTAATLRAAGLDTIVALDAEQAIAQALPRFLEAVRAGSAPIASDATIRAQDRRSRAGELAALLDELV